MEDNILSGKLIATALTFDDVLIAPRYSTVVPSEVDVATRLTARIAWFVFCELGLDGSYFANYDGVECRYMGLGTDAGNLSISASAILDDGWSG